MKRETAKSSRLATLNHHLARVSRHIVTPAREVLIKKWESAVNAPSLIKIALSAHV